MVYVSAVAPPPKAVLMEMGSRAATSRGYVSMMTVSPASKGNVSVIVCCASGLPHTRVATTVWPVPNVPAVSRNKETAYMTDAGAVIVNDCGTVVLIA